MDHLSLLLVCASVALPIFFVCVPAAADGDTPKAPSRLRCEYREAPLAVDTPAPRLSWIMTDQRRGAGQTAYQILVASSPELLEADQGDRWDSERVDSRESVQIPYAGAPLEAFDRCFWKVRIWDEQDRVSPWSAPAEWGMGFMNQPWPGEYIGLDGEERDTEYPQLRQAVELPADAAAARWYVNALGFYEAYVNGAQVSTSPLDPGPAQHNKRSFYVAHNVTPFLREGSNVLGLWLGRGPYSEGLPGVVHSGPMVRAVLRVECVDGSTHLFPTGETWRGRPGNIRRIGDWRSSHYGGETVDGRRHDPDWSTRTGDGGGWRGAAVLEPAPHEVTSQAVEPNTIVRRFEPRHVRYQGQERWIVDFGVNLSGWFEMRFDNLEPGQRITLEYGDRLDEDGLDTFSQRDTYIGRGEPGETFRNRFNYHAFRYVRIDGLASRPSPDHMAAMLIRNGFPVRSSFACSDDALNEVHDMVHYTLECLSLGGYLVDCPHIERLGYGGDGLASTPTALTMFGMGALYTTWMAHWRDCQRPDGDLPHTAPNPYRAGGGPYWCAFIIGAPWEVYRHNGDTRILEENYPAMKQWLEGYVGSHRREDGLLMGWPNPEYRNWYLGDWARPKRDESELERSTHLVVNCVMVESHARLAKIAALLGHEADAARHAQDAEALRAAVQREFYHADQHSYADGTQLDLAYPLLTGVTPPALREAVLAKLEQKILVEHEGHLDAGLVGVPVITQALTALGRSDLLHTMVGKRTFPSWGYMLENGATTTWEHWDAHRSHIHNCYNGIGTWFYQGPGGIRPLDEGPGFSAFAVHPEVTGGLRWASAYQETAHGLIRVAWRIEDGHFELDLRAPANTTAHVYLPAANADAVHEGAQPAVEASGVDVLGYADGRCILRVMGGEYQFKAPMAE